MARRMGIVLWSAGMLAVGLAVGGHIDSLKVAQPVQAISSTSSRAMSGADVLMLTSDHIARISEAVMPSTVHIQAVRNEKDGRSVEETGSGVIMRSRSVNGNFVVTNNHVIRGARLQDIQLRLPDGRETTPVRVYRDAATDVAVMQLKETGLRSALWGNSQDLKIGHQVLAVGSPFGLSRSVTMGIVSATGRRALSLTADDSVTNQDFVQTDAAINPGNSGGPLIDMNGEVVGINTAIASNSGGNEGIGFSIPSQLARHVFEHLVKWGKVRRGYLGVELDPSFDQATANRLGLSRAVGAHVTRVYRQRPTPASQAGIRPGDVIVAFNDVRVEDENHLINLVGLARIDQSLSVEVMRGGRPMAVKVTLTDRDSYRSASDAPGTFMTR
ncbi:MAG: trypsin-like peptidase domain-containing protein [Fuerstiella sp.]|nr:trypsin-like peptidase domain-containing protein [Fuerstiella sp.]